MKKIAKFRSEDGAASVLEATIVFPLVFLVVVFLVILGFTYAQRGFLTYHSSSLASYIAKVICYPGYNYIDPPFYEPAKEEITLGDIKNAMNTQAPYRYLFGLFGTEYSSAEDVDGNEIVKESAKKMAKDYLKTHGFLKASSGPIEAPPSLKNGTVEYGDGYVCAISANTSRVTVFLGQKYIFANYFRMIGINGKEMTVYSQTHAFVSDSLEVVRMTDFAFDTVNFVLDKLGIDTSVIENIKEMINKVTKRN